MRSNTQFDTPTAQRFAPAAHVLLASASGEQHFLARALRREGYLVTETELESESRRGMFDFDVQERTAYVDLVVLDASEDPEGALEWLEKVRSFDWALPVVFIADECVYFDVWPEATRLGVLGFFSKPLDIKRFLSILGEVVPTEVIDCV